MTTAAARQLQRSRHGHSAKPEQLYPLLEQMYPYDKTVLAVIHGGLDPRSAQRIVGLQNQSLGSLDHGPTAPGETEGHWFRNGSWK